MMVKINSFITKYILSIIKNIVSKQIYKRNNIKNMNLQENILSLLVISDSYDILMKIDESRVKISCYAN